MRRFLNQSPNRLLRAAFYLHFSIPKKKHNLPTGVAEQDEGRGKKWDVHISKSQMAKKN